MKTFLAGLSIIVGASFAAAGPKYGPDAVPLSKNSNRSYFMKSKAPDYWALSPYYVHQENGSACSAAALVTVINGLRKDLSLTDQDELVSHKYLTEKLSDEKYKGAVSGDVKTAISSGAGSLGVSVERLAEVLRGALGKLKVGAQVEFIAVDQKNKDESRRRFHDFLVKNERTDKDFLILNFTQGMLTGDSEGMKGHIAAVGGYDERRKLVLILDPDRQWYEPYWSPEDKVFEAVADLRSDRKAPGYVYVKNN
jgi:hypothetical protein